MDSLQYAFIWRSDLIFIDQKKGTETDFILFLRTQTDKEFLKIWLVVGSILLSMWKQLLIKLILNYKFNQIGVNLTIHVINNACCS